MSFIKCSNCGSSRNIVTDSRKSQVFTQQTTRRRRKCIDCFNKWTTYELNENLVRSLENINKMFQAVKPELTKSGIV